MMLKWHLRVIVRSSHSFPCKKNPPHILLPHLYHRSESASVYLIFTFIYTLCTDVRYWRGGVHINLCNLIPHLKVTMDMFYTDAACYSYNNLAWKSQMIIELCKAEEWSGKCRGEKTGTLLKNLIPGIVICFYNFVCYGLLGLENTSVKAW